MAEHIVVTTRVDEGPRLAQGTELGECQDCAAQVYVSDTTLSTLKGVEYDLICFPCCLKRDLNEAVVSPMSQFQRDEMGEALGLNEEGLDRLSELGKEYLKGK